MNLAESVFCFETEYIYAYVNCNFIMFLTFSVCGSSALQRIESLSFQRQDIVRRRFAAARGDLSQEAIKGTACGG